MKEKKKSFVFYYHHFGAGGVNQVSCHELSPSVLILFLHVGCLARVNSLNWARHCLDVTVPHSLTFVIRSSL